MRVNIIEPGSLTPLIFQPLVREATVVNEKLTSELAVKRNKPYSHVTNWFRCYLYSWLDLQ